MNKLNQAARQWILDRTPCGRHTLETLDMPINAWKDVAESFFI